MTGMKEVSTRELRYLQRWVFCSILIGVVAGLGAIAFYLLLQVTSAFFLGYISGYHPVSPTGELDLSLLPFPPTPFRLWILALMPAIGGLIAGLITYSFAPEAEGDGTDAVIDAFHNKKGEIRKRVPLVKTIASAITIGSGGSAGREGPSAMLGATIGSLCSKFLKLGERERRKIVSAAAGAGIAAIFKSPLGGAFFGIETFTYYIDYEYAASVQVAVDSPLEFDFYEILPDREARDLDVMANDRFWPDYAGDRRITAVSTSQLGGDVTIIDSGTAIRYAPPEDAYGEDKFVYFVDDTYPAEVRISIPNPLHRDEYDLVQRESLTRTYRPDTIQLSFEIIRCRYD